MDYLEIRKQIEEAAENRVNFLKAREKNVYENEQSLKEWSALRNILEIHYQECFPTGDILIRVVRSKVISNASREISNDCCEIREITNDL